MSLFCSAARVRIRTPHHSEGAVLQACHGSPDGSVQGFSQAFMLVYLFQFKSEFLRGQQPAVAFRLHSTETWRIVILLIARLSLSLSLAYCLLLVDVIADFYSLCRAFLVFLFLIFFSAVFFTFILIQNKIIQPFKLSK